jgi:hypothetical protein
MTNPSKTPAFTLFQHEPENAKITEKMLALEQSIYELTHFLNENGIRRQPRISRGKPDDIRSACRKLQAGKNVVSLQIGKIGKDFTHINPVTQHFKNIVNANAHSADARTPAAFAGFDGDSFKQIRFQGKLLNKS